MPSLTSELFVRLIDGVTKPAAAVSRSLLGIDRAADRVGQSATFGQRFADASARATAQAEALRGSMVESVAVGYALAQALSAPITAAMEFESAMADVRKVVDFPTPEAFKQMGNDIITMSREIPMAAQGLADIVAAAGQAGIAGDELLKFTEGAAKVGVAFDIGAGDAGDAMAKLRTALGYTNEEVFLLADAMNHLSNAQASSAADILDVVRRVGAQSKLYGFTAEQTAAFASAMLAAGAESEVAATSFRNMGMYLTKGASATNRQEAAFKKLGLTAEGTAKKMQEDAVGTTIDVLKRLAALPKEIQGAVSSDLFGNEARALGPLLTNLELVESSMAMVAEQSLYAGSAQKEFEVRAKTTANAVQLFKNNISALGITIGNALIPAMNDAMKAVAPLVTALSDWSAANPELTKNLVLATAGIVAFKVATTGARFAAAFMRSGVLQMIGPFVRMGVAANTAATSAIALQTALAGGLPYGKWAKFGTALSAIAMSVPGVSALAGALGTVGGVIMGPVGVAIAAIAGAGLLIWKYWDRLSSIFSGVGQAIGEVLAPAIDAARPYFEWLSPIGDAIASGWNMAKDAISSFGQWLGSFFTQEALSEEEKAAFAKAGYDAAMGMVNSMKDAINALVDWFAALPGRILTAIGNIDLGSLIKWPQPPAWLSRLWNGGTIDVQAPAPVEARATGGPVKKGRHYVVGDGGEPEYFSPGADGFITPLSKTQPMDAGSIGGARGGSKGSRAPGQVTFAPVWQQNAPIYGVADLEARFQEFAERQKRDFDSMMAGSFSDAGAA